jgi:hypothetical protein
MAEQEELKLIISAEFANENEFDRVQREIKQLETAVRDAKGRFKKGSLTLVEKDELSRLKKVRADLRLLVAEENKLNEAIRKTATSNVSLRKAQNEGGKTYVEGLKLSRQQNKQLLKETNARITEVKRESRLQAELNRRRKESGAVTGRDKEGRFARKVPIVERAFKASESSIKQLAQERVKLEQQRAIILAELQRQEADIERTKTRQLKAAQTLRAAEAQIVAKADERLASEKSKLASEKGTLLRLQEEQALRKANLRLAKVERALAADRLAQPGEKLSPVDRLALQTEFNSAQADLARVVRSSNKEVKKQNEFFNRLKGTIRGVVVGLVVYRGITRSIDAIKFGLKNAVEFGNELETARLSVAGLVAGASDIVDSQGNLLQGAEKYAEALKISRVEITEIRKQALGTTATFEQLLTIYQQNVSQALGNGLDLSQFREVALLFSQGATLLGVPQTQLAEEIRSVLQGTVRPRDTRIATALGITNPDIRKAKEAGRLFEFIQEKFSGIAEASEALRNTLPVIASDLEDAFRLAGAAGTEQLRDTLGRVGSEVRDALSNDEAQRELATFIQFLVEPFDEITEILGRDGQPFGELIGLLAKGFFELGESAALVATAFAPLVQVFNILFSVALGLLEAVQELSGSALGRALSSFAAIATASLSASAALKLLIFLTPKQITAGIGKLVTAARSLTFSLAGLKAAALAVNSAFLATPLLILAGIVAVEKFAASLPGLNASLEAAANGLKVTIGIAKRFFSGEFGAAGNFAAEAKLVQDQVKELRNAQRELRIFEEQKRKARGASLAEAERIDKRIQERVDRISNLEDEINRFISASPFKEDLKGLTPEGGVGLDGFSDDLFEAISSGVRSLSNKLFGLGEDIGEGISAGAVSKLLTAEDFAKSLREFNRGFQGELAAAQAGALGTGTEDVIKSLNDALVETEKKNEGLLRTQKEINEAIKTQSAFSSRLLLLKAQRKLIDADLKQGEKDRLDLVTKQLEILNAQADVQQRPDLQTAERLRQVPVFGPLGDQLRQVIEGGSQIRENLIEREQILKRVEARNEGVAAAELLLAKLGQRYPQENAAFKEFVRLAKERNEVDLDSAEILKLQNEEIDKQLERTRKLLSLSNVGRGGAGAIDTLSSQLTTEAISQTLFTGTFQTLRAGVQNAATTALQAAFTGEDVDFGLLARRLGQDLANQFVNAVIDKFLFQPLLNALSELFGLELFNNIALEANTVALTTLTAAISASGGLSAGAAVAGAAAQGAFPGAAPGGALGGSVSAAGHIGGGAVSSALALPSAPSGLDPRDTIPAFLRPGEYVATPEMERRAPGLFYALEKLRRGVHGLPNFGSLRNAPKGFATGGPASGTLRTADQLASSNQGTAVLPVLVTDERSMRRIHDNPQFVAGINKRTNQQALRMLNKRPMR